MEEVLKFKSGDTIKYPKTGEVKFRGIELPKYVASVEISGGVVFNLTKKPNRVHRFFARVLLGFKYFDLK